MTEPDSGTTDSGTTGARTVYAVSQLNEILRALVEDSLPALWIQAEISNFSKPSSGHWYFTLKDELAQIRCAMFRKSNYYIRPTPQNGDAVLVRARASVYPARGELQLIVEHLEAAGSGALLRAFEELKNRLAAEGLFDAALKRPLPRLPRRIGLVTSGTGAAVHDVLTTLARRWPLAAVLLQPVPVQGPAAPAAIVKALQRLSQRAGALAPDVILLVRGGGSLEDLWAFNDESVARAIRASSVPVVTGVGHEIDITIADFAADLRAATPTAAAELISPDRLEIGRSIAASLTKMSGPLRLKLHAAGIELVRRELRLSALHPSRRLHLRAQRIDELELRLHRMVQLELQRDAERRAAAMRRLYAASPLLALGVQRQLLAHSADRIEGLWRSRQARATARLAQGTALLASLNPQNVLDRGYAIVADAQGRILRDAATTAVGRQLQVRLARGLLTAEVGIITAPASPESPG